MKSLYGTIGIAALLLLSLPASADVDCVNDGTCQSGTGTVLQLVMDTGAFMNAFSSTLPVADPTNAFMGVKLDGGPTAAGFTVCGLSPTEVIGMLAYDTPGRQAIFETLSTAYTTGQTISVVISDAPASASGPVCEIAAVYLGQ